MGNMDNLYYRSACNHFNYAFVYRRPISCLIRFINRGLFYLVKKGSYNNSWIYYAKNWECFLRSIPNK